MLDHFKLVMLLVLFSVMFFPAGVTADPSDSADAERLKNREAKFERLSGTTLVGHFTDSNKADTSELTEERYVLEKVVKVDGENWLFRARIQYGDRDLTVPLTLPVRWAGDTPVICVDNLPIPGMGTFTARVMIYEGHYAGFWKGADHGGHLFGTIQREPAP